MNSRYHRRGHLRAIAAPVWHHFRDLLSNREYRALHRFHRQIASLPRFQSGVVTFRGRPIRFCDNASFLSAWDEIFVNRIYAIPSESVSPLLIDVGANIGLAALYWSTIHPRFRYVGFEPDPVAAVLCRENLKEWGCPEGLREMAVTPAGSRVRFMCDHADGGRIGCGEVAGDVIDVPCAQLSSLLDEEVDLLKIDIEGAEFGVLEEARSRLDRVKRVFVEVHDAARHPGRLSGVLSILEDSGFRCVAHTVMAPEMPFLAASGVASQEHRFLLNVYGVRARDGSDA